jgi:hypothetical protein
MAMLAPEMLAQAPSDSSTQGGKINHGLKAR